MKLFRYLFLLVLCFVLAACSTFPSKTFPPGTPEEEVVAKLGRPTHRYEDGQYHLLEYATIPAGQQTYMARFDSQGKLVSYEQVLTVEKFNLIKVGASTKEDVLRLIGAPGPGEISYLPLRNWEVWTYPYQQNTVWNLLFHVHFDSNGIVQQTLSTPDPRYDPNDRGRGAR